MQGLVEISQIGGIRVFSAKPTTVPKQRLEYENFFETQKLLGFLTILELVLREGLFFLDSPWWLSVKNLG